MLAHLQCSLFYNKNEVLLSERGMNCDLVTSCYFK